MLLDVKAMLSSLIVQQQALHMKLERLEEGQQQLLGIMLNMAPNPNVDIAELDSILQPKRTIEELNKFDQDLKSDIALRKKLVRLLLINKVVNSLLCEARHIFYSLTLNLYHAFIFFPNLWQKLR